MEQVTVEFQGKQITAALNEGQTLSGEPLARAEPSMKFM